jgi:hypothetical protein
VREPTWADRFEFNHRLFGEMRFHEVEPLFPWMQLGNFAGE